MPPISSRPLALHHLALVGLVAIAIVLGGAYGGGVFDTAPAPTMETAILVGDAPLVTTAAFGPICPQTDPDGCYLSDVVCSGYKCCCRYTCGGGGSYNGPCYTTGPF